MPSLASVRLYGILDLGYVSAEAAPKVLCQMVEGGVGIVQLRAKKQSPAEVEALARKLHPIAKEAGIPFILNDHPALAGALGLDGAHIGQDDLSVPEARALLGPGRILGKSTHSVAQAVATAAEGVDYIGFGPLYATPTKPDYTPIGLEEIRKVHELVSIPVFCIGGIKLENLPDVLAAGARRVVIVSGILQAPDIAAYCREVNALLASNSQT